MFSMLATTRDTSMVRGCTSCLRLNARRSRVSYAERWAARSISSSSARPGAASGIR